MEEHTLLHCTVEEISWVASTAKNINRLTMERVPMQQPLCVCALGDNIISDSVTFIKTSKSLKHTDETVCQNFFFFPECTCGILSGQTSNL